jgi:hypothetical protein
MYMLHKGGFCEAGIPLNDFLLHKGGFQEAREINWVNSIS